MAVLDSPPANPPKRVCFSMTWPRSLSALGLCGCCSAALTSHLLQNLCFSKQVYDINLYCDKDLNSLPGLIGMS